MNKTLLSSLIAVALAAVAMPVEADHALGCTGTDPDVCHDHYQSGDGTCAFDSESESVTVNGADYGAYGQVYSYCLDFGWLACEGDGVYASAYQANEGHTSAQAGAYQAGCGGQYCAVWISVYDTNTETSQFQELYGEACDDTL